MLLQNPSTSRAQWYDRNPLDVFASYYAVTVAPHAPTTRWSYTVPAGRKCWLDTLQGFMYRAVVGAPGAYAEIQVNITPSGGSQSIQAVSQSKTNVVGDIFPIRPTTFGLLQAGDNINSQTSDSSTGGSFDMAIFMKGSEFDA